MAVPEAAPATAPALLIVATVVLPLVQVPNNIEFDNVVVPPAHKLAVPVIVDGVASTVTTG
jgi:hypothetical protein